MKKRFFNRGWFGSTISYVYLTILAVIAAFPLVWILLSSVKGKGEITGDPTAFLPKAITFENYRIVWEQLHFGNNIANSIIIAGSTTLIAVIISALAAYGVVRFFPRTGKAMTRVLITTYMFPPILLAVPYSIIIGKMGMMNNRLSLVIVYLSFSVPYAVWLLVGFSRRSHWRLKRRHGWMARTSSRFWKGRASHCCARNRCCCDLHVYQCVE